MVGAEFRNRPAKSPSLSRPVRMNNCSPMGHTANLGHAEFEAGFVATKIITDQLALPVLQDVGGTISCDSFNSQTHGASVAFCGVATVLRGFEGGLEAAILRRGCDSFNSQNPALGFKEWKLSRELEGLSSSSRCCFRPGSTPISPTHLPIQPLDAAALLKV